ncbi:hypothetical protein FZC66_20065 [Priestia megaterium]|nr:hypothetical protein FZC66_20065 [Priestia megaterium]
MIKHIGLSSGSVPSLNSEEIIELLDRLKGSVVDLRIGKGHAWEQQGLCPFKNSKIKIGFIGLSTVLGDESWDSCRIQRHAEVYQGYPLKVFARKDCIKNNLSLVEKQVQCLTNIAGNVKDIYVETHYGYASISDHVDLYEEMGISTLLDIMGLAKISQDPINDSKKISEFTYGVQTKGFDWKNPLCSLHLPISKIDLQNNKNILDNIKSEIKFLTIETKSHSFREDFILTSKFFSEVGEKNEISHYWR